MRQSIDDYVRRSDACQRRKEGREFKAPLEDPEEPFEITSCDITGPYPVTRNGNKYLFTFIDNFTKYAEAIPIPNQTAEVCAKVFVTHVVARHRVPRILISDQGRNFVSNFFKEVCRLLDVKKVQTTPLHPVSNACIERFHRALHTGLSHFVDTAGTNWDEVVPLFLMAYRATPHSTT
jgi:transposase InsO family protein